MYAAPPPNPTLDVTQPSAQPAHQIVNVNVTLNVPPPTQPPAASPALGARELREKAATIGASGADIDHARDADDPVKALQDLIDATEQQLARKKEEAANTAATAAAAAAAHQAALRSMGVKELRHRAAEVGLSDDAIEEARDSSDPKASLLALIEHRPLQGP